MRVLNHLDLDGGAGGISGHPGAERLREIHLGQTAQRHPDAHRGQSAPCADLIRLRKKTCMRSAAGWGWCSKTRTTSWWPTWWRRTWPLRWKTWGWSPVKSAAGWIRPSSRWRCTISGMHAPHQLSGGTETAGCHCRGAGDGAGVHRAGRAHRHAGPQRPAGGAEHRPPAQSGTKGTTVVLITHYMDEACQAGPGGGDGPGAGCSERHAQKRCSVRSTPSAVWDLDLPQVTELCWRLRQAGVPLPEGILTEPECLDALCQLLGGGAK